ncbi:MAG: CDF family Co(II)/Ni(II) efflux transporter DmeF [Planctomycetes bacterium]|nr:CDF family Co(II)/Ni(II) efflux transporter DmeF [Planctomycetota bacterium]
MTVVHEHCFLGARHGENQRRTWTVIAVTAAMMVAEIVCGTLFGSMALLADGWHMATHAGALSISALAYAFALRRTRDRRFSFGTGKVGDLAGFASAVVLAVVALWIGVESGLRLLSPVAISFDEAIWVAGLGLCVNVVCALVLGGGHGHEHADGYGEGEVAGEECGESGHTHLHRDHNLRSAYLHVLADAVTSVAAILGLLAGKFLGWAWFDPVVGVLGAVMIALWSIGLLRDTAAVLLDMVPGGEVEAAVRERLERDGDRVGDLHVWRVGPGHLAVVVEVVTASARPAAEYRQRLAGIRHLSHVTVEVTRR